MRLFIIVCLVALAGGFEERTVFGKLKSGFQLAGNLLGIDRARGVAQLVSEAFGKVHRKGDGGEGASNIFSGFLRILGFDSKKIGAIAVNAIIFVAQLISSSLTRPAISQVYHTRKDDSPFNWLMNNTEVSHILQHVKDKELPNSLIQHMKERSLDEESDCVQLLICKSAPLIWGMQKALDKNTSISGFKSLYAYLPTIEAFSDHGELCEKEHRFCFVDT